MKFFTMVRFFDEKNIPQRLTRSFFSDDSVAYSMNFQVVCEPREFISYDIHYNSDITFCLREFKVNNPLTCLLV